MLSSVLCGFAVRKKDRARAILFHTMRRDHQRIKYVILPPRLVYRCREGMPDPVAGHKRPPGCGWTGAPGKDITSLQLDDFLVGPGVIVALSDATGDYQIYISSSGATRGFADE